MRFLSEAPLQVEHLLAAVSGPAHGAVATFLGAVRDHHAGRVVASLDYQAYGPLADAECARIVAEAEERFGCRVALQHRVGTLAVGDLAVAVAAGSGHRAEAFEACRYVIEELKRRVPIWKREVYADGTVAWVDPTAPGGVVPAEGRP